MKQAVRAEGISRGLNFIRLLDLVKLSVRRIPICVVFGGPTNPIRDGRRYSFSVQMYYSYIWLSVVYID